MAYFSKPKAPSTAKKNTNSGGNSFSSSNKTFTRDSKNNLIVRRADGTSQTYTPGQSGFAAARKALEQSGGSWSSLGSGSGNSAVSSSRSHYDKNVYQPPSGSVGVGDFQNGSYSANGRTFERDQYGNMIIKDRYGTKTYAPDTAEHNLARNELAKWGGNWDAMKAYQNYMPEAPATWSDPHLEELSKLAGQYELSQTQSLGKGVRPDPYIKSDAHFGQWMGNMGEYYGGLQFDRENMGSERDLALQANSLGKQNALLNLEAGRAKINQDYDEQETQSYIRQMQGLRNLDESLAVQGIGGGATESARLAYGNEYQAGMNQLGLGRANAITDLDRQLQSEAFRWDQQAMEIEAQNARERTAAAERGRNQAMEWAWRATQAAQEERWRQQQFEAQQAAQNREWDFRERSYADEIGYRDRLYDDKYYGRGFEYDVLRAELGLKQDKLAWQQASRAAKKGVGGSGSSGGISSSYDYSPVSILSPEEGNAGRIARQSARPSYSEFQQYQQIADIDRLIAIKEKAMDDLQSGRINRNEYNVIARDVELALGGR